MKLNSALRNATPSAKPPTISAAEAGWPSSSTSAISTAVATRAAATEEQAVDAARCAAMRACSSAAVVIELPRRTPRLTNRSRASSSGRPTWCATTQSGGSASAVHSTIEPS